MGLYRQKRTAGTAWLEKTNPLAGMSIREAQAIFDCARNGDTQRLHWMFQEIESANPVLMTCVERRVSALSGFRSSVTARPSADPTLAEEQQDAVTRFLDGIENFTDALEHLDLAFFRGFSYVQPIWEADGTVRRIECPDSWLFLSKDGELYYNPVCDGLSRNAELVTPEARLVGVHRRRPIDYPALSIHIRQAVGDRDWGRFLERIALPKPAVIMAPSATDKEKDKYVEAAERVEDGQVSVWPNGSSLTDFMGGSRGQDPFSTFIRHQEEKIVLLSTGGTLTSLAQADTGSLAGGAQMKVWREIVRKDATVVAQAVNRMVREYLARAFPGRPVAAEFTFDTGDKLTAQEAANVAATLKGAGWLVKQDELEKATGFTLEKAPEQPPQTGFQGGLNGLPLTNKADTPFKTADKPFKNSRRGSDGQGDAPARQELLGAFSRDLGPASEEVKKLLADLEAGKDVTEAAKTLVEKLPELMPEDPAMAAVIAEEMARAFGEVKAKGEGEELANSGTSEGAKKGWETRKKNGWTPEQVAENKVKIAALAKKALSDRTSDDALILGKTEGEAAKDIKALTGIDVTGYSQEITTHDIRHEDKRHGPLRKIGKKKYGERRADQVPISMDDYERIPELLSDYDNIELGDPERNTGRPSVVYTKKFPDGVLYGVEVVIEDEKKMHYKTGWKKI